MEEFPAIGSAYRDMSDAVADAGPLDAKTRELIKIGIAIGSGQEGATHIEATFTNNRILESDPNSVGFMGGGAGKTVLHLDGNEFAGRTFLSFGGYAPGALEITSNGTDIDWKSSVGNNTVRGPKSGS